MRKARNKKRGGKKAFLAEAAMQASRALPSPPMSTRTRSGQNKDKPKIWREDEVEAFISALKEHGKEWAKLALSVNSVKNPYSRDEKDMKEFFEKNSRKYKLNKILSEKTVSKKDEKLEQTKKDDVKNEEDKKDEVKKEPEEKKQPNENVLKNLQIKIPPITIKTETTTKITNDVPGAPENEIPKVLDKVKIGSPKVKDEPKTPELSPSPRTVLNSPGRTLPLPTVPGISPPRPKIGPDSPRAQRIGSPRPGTPQGRTPIELPFVPGLRHPLPRVPTSPKPRVYHMEHFILLNAYNSLKTSVGSQNGLKMSFPVSDFI